MTAAIIAPILITGGSQRLGLAIAQFLNSDEFEPRRTDAKHTSTTSKTPKPAVIVTYRRKKPALEALIDQGVVAIKADFATDEGITSFIKALKEHTPVLGGIIHNASDWDKETPNADLAQLFSNMMQVHASAPYQINIACKDMLVNGADVIHMTDYVQDKGSSKHIAYAASKAALHNLTLSFASLLAPNVKVNSIAPSLLMFNDDDSQAYKQKALSKSILGICPGAQEAVNAVDFIFKSKFLTGQVIHLNGGRNIK
ncbi:MAG: dihydromonapterin reductase/dihydrofolate reductase [Alphaproteobacteria bacterium]|jgi:dihydromonapterin reductase/dihydrofolate reductase